MTPTNTPNRDDLPADVTAEVPEADAVEQATPAVPDTVDAKDPGNTNDAGRTALPPDQPQEADPADAWEQALPVPGEDDDDYDYDGTTGSGT
jgi:hypothetical protein